MAKPGFKAQSVLVTVDAMTLPQQNGAWVEHLASDQRCQEGRRNAAWTGRCPSVHKTTGCQGWTHQSVPTQKVIPSGGRKGTRGPKGSFIVKKDKGLCSIKALLGQHEVQGLPWFMPFSYWGSRDLLFLKVEEIQEENVQEGKYK